MVSLSRSNSFNRYDLRMALFITKREVRDSLRDWRIIIPIVILTLVFPALATFTARVLFNFTAQYGAGLVGDRLIPFLLLIVGFFPHVIFPSNRLGNLCGREGAQKPRTSFIDAVN